MTEQNQTSIDNNILRLLIREAVEREIATTLAPLRTQVQVQDGMLKQFNRDVTLVQSQFSDLDELVRGNPKQNLIGLAEQIKAQNGLIERMQTTLNQAIIDMQRNVQASVAEIRKELASDVAEIKKKQDEATTHREAMLNQWRGAKYAIIALGIVTGLPYLELLGKLIHIVP